MKRINVTKSTLPPFEEYIKEIESIWGNHWLTNMGEKHNRLEDSIRSYLKADNVSLFSNGHFALEMALQALDLKGEIITTPYTFASTTHAIVRNNLTPVFCDIDANNCTIDPNKIEGLITDKTAAILPVHVYGNACNIEAIDDIAKKHNLKVVYDAAHVFGVEYKGKGIANFGDMAMFSLHATKVFNTIEGGVIACRDNNYIKKLYNLKNFGIQDAEHVVAVGANSKMNEFSAAMGLCNLKYIDKQIEQRRYIAERYIENLSTIKGLKLLLHIDNDVKSNYAYMPILFDSDILGFDRDAVYDEMLKENIVPRKYFYPIATEFDCYKDCYKGQTTPIAKRISENVLTLPMYADLSLTDVDRVCNVIKAMI